MSKFTGSLSNSDAAGRFSQLADPHAYTQVKPPPPPPPPPPIVQQLSQDTYSASSAQTQAPADGAGSLQTGADLDSAPGQSPDLQVVGQVLSLLSSLLPQLQPAINQAAQSLGIADSTGTGGSINAAGSTDGSPSSPDSSSSQANASDLSDTSGAGVSPQAGTATPYANLDSIISQLNSAISPMNPNSGGSQAAQQSTSGASAAPTGTEMPQANSLSTPSSGLLSSLPPTTQASSLPPTPLAGGLPTGSSPTLPGSSTLAANKAAVYNASQQAGATPDQTAVILAIGQLETTNLDPSQRDTSKDGGPSQNYSAFNINKDLAMKLGWNPATGPDLNDPANTPYVVGLMVKGMNQMGTDGFLAYLRGGSTGAANPTASNVQDYITAIKSAAGHLQANPADYSSSVRVASFVQHI